MALRFWLAFGVLASLGLVCYLPFFLPGEFPYPESIGRGYAGMARFVWAHPHPWGWNPWQYCGLPAQFMYLPLVPYLSAAVSRVISVEPDAGYRILTGICACFTPLGLFYCLWYFSRSLAGSMLGGLASLFVSPAYSVITNIDGDRGLFYLPWRIQVIAKYGEGPHAVGLALLPLALVAVWRASAGGGSRFVAALALAAVTLTNWVSSLGLAIIMLLLLLSVLGRARETGFSYGRFFSACLWGYGLACFWLTPSFVRTTALNWPKDAFGYKPDPTTGWYLLGWIGCVLLLRVCLLGQRDVFRVWVSLGFAAFTYLVVVFYDFRHDTIPESRRYVLEFEVFVILAGCAWLIAAYRSHNSTVRICGGLALACFLASSLTQLQKTAIRRYQDWKLTPVAETNEYQVAKRLEELKPKGRVFLTGGFRFQANSWVGVQQTGGTFESGLHNRMPVDLAYGIRTGIGLDETVLVRESIRRLLALGVEYFVVPRLDSKEFYRDFRHVEQFEKELTPIGRIGNNWIYQTPFRSFAQMLTPEHARTYEAYFVEEDRLPALGRPEFQWIAPARFRVRNPAPSGILSVQVNYHAGWRAIQRGQELPLSSGPLGFIQAKPLTGDPIEFSFEGTLEQKLFGAISGLTWLGSIALWLRPKRDRNGLTPLSASASTF